MTSQLPVPTFRDPAGSLTLEEDRAVRRIHPASRADALAFVESAFYLRVQQRGDMVATTVEESVEELSFIHPRISVPTYPWEWTPSQWVAAGDLTLRLGQEGLADGWILKDATPLNILFDGSRPVLVDVLSFERRDSSSAIWLAYGQYLRTFLLPLLMNRILHWPLELTLFKRDGYEPQELYQAMSWAQRLSRAAFWPITLPAWLDKGSGAKGKAPASKPQDAELTAHILNKRMGDLRERTRRALPKDAASNWAEYQTTLSHYTADEGEQKHVWVRQVLEDTHPPRVLDIGANTGEYSNLAAAAGAQVVALERDGASADRLFQRSRAQGSSILTIHADFARPTPSVGWETNESSGLLARLEGRFELVMMLAVIHHLILMEQIPIPAIMALMHRLTLRHLIVEWVPVTDPMYQSLMRGRDDLYGVLAESDLLSACAGLFSVVRRETLGNGRVLFLFAKV